MADTKTVHVAHLGGIDAGYRMTEPYDESKPTVVLVNSYLTSSELYRSQFANKQMKDACNLIAIELLGHGATRAQVQHFTYWDTAIMNLQVLDALKIKGKIFVLGTSQGGWITVRMALLAPELITGIIPLGTSLDTESERTRQVGCWNGPGLLSGNITEWASIESTPDWVISKDTCNFLIDVGFGSDVSSEVRDFWIDTIQKNYRGNEGRQRARVATINLRDRDGLHGRLSDVRCPVLWLHGTSDSVYSVANAEMEIKLFVNSADAQLKVVEGGEHFLSFSHPEEVGEALVDFVKKHA